MTVKIACPPLHNDRRRIEAPWQKSLRSCGWQAMRGEELATFLSKDLKYPRGRHLSTVVQSGSP